MKKSDQLLAFVITQVQKRFERQSLPEIEKLSIQFSIADIFARNWDLEQTYYELLDYLEQDAEMPSMIPEIEKYFSNL